MIIWTTLHTVHSYHQAILHGKMLSISVHWNCGHFTEADLVQLLSPIREADVLGSTGLMLWSYLEEHLEKPRPLRVCLQLPEWMIDFYLGRVLFWSSFGILDFVHFCSSKVATWVRRAIWSWHCKTVRRLRAVPPPSCHVWTCDFVSRAMRLTMRCPRCPGSFAWEWKCFYSSLLRDNCPVWWCYIPFKSQCGFVCFCSVELEYYSSLWKSMTREFVTFSQSPELKHFRFHMLLGVVAIPLLTVASLHQGVRVSPCRVDCTCVSMWMVNAWQTQQGFKGREHENIECLQWLWTCGLEAYHESAHGFLKICAMARKWVLQHGCVVSRYYHNIRLARLCLGFFWGLTTKPGAAALGFENSRALRVANDITIVIIILRNIHANQLGTYQISNVYHIQYI